MISPHPPIIIPAVGGDDTKLVKATINAMQRAAQQLAAAAPDELVIVAPHEGHGFEVPLYYLTANLPSDLPIEQILVTNPSYRYYYDLGHSRGQQAGGDTRRTAVIASGDLSHVLEADGPYGFDPAGPQLDEAIVTAVRANDAEALLSLDPGILDHGAECGVRSILYLMGALAGSALRPQILSYEGPFGVGYLVTTYEATT
jgi:AmmeMemoRadiSam system protein B